MWNLPWALLTVFAMPPSQIKSDEVVVFYPTYACLNEAGTEWNVRVHGSIFEPEQDSLKRAALVGVLRRQLGLKKSSPDAELFERRVRLFLVDNERGKTISIRVGDEVLDVGTSRPNGHFRGSFRLSAERARELLGTVKPDGRWLTFEALTRPGDKRRFTGRVQFLGPRGVSIISDVDDTIKHTEVTRRRELLANTFLRPFRPVDGMAAIYAAAAEREMAVHYVSGSPWQLYRPLEEFRQAEGFPAGSFHLKHFRPTDSSAWELFASQEKTKLAAISQLLADFPRRRFILIGDTSEQDVEIYGGLARRHAARILGVLVRNVTEESPEDERFRAALGDYDRERWRLFRRAEEIKELVAKYLEIGRS